VDSRPYQAKHDDPPGNQAVTGDDPALNRRSLDSWE
jgi:hypothetical protein